LVFSFRYDDDYHHHTYRRSVFIAFGFVYNSVLCVVDIRIFLQIRKVNQEEIYIYIYIYIYTYIYSSTSSNELGEQTKANAQGCLFDTTRTDMTDTLRPTVAYKE
jgi:hypothetical protein